MACRGGGRRRTHAHGLRDGGESSHSGEKTPRKVLQSLESLGRQPGVEDSFLVVLGSSWQIVLRYLCTLTTPILILGKIQTSRF